MLFHNAGARGFARAGGGFLTQQHQRDGEGEEREDHRLEGGAAPAVKGKGSRDDRGGDGEGARAAPHAGPERRVRGGRRDVRKYERYIDDVEAAVEVVGREARGVVFGAAQKEGHHHQKGEQREGGGRQERPAPQVGEAAGGKDAEHVQETRVCRDVKLVFRVKAGYNAVAHAYGYRHHNDDGYEQKVSAFPGAARQSGRNGLRRAASPVSRRLYQLCNL